MIRFNREKIVAVLSILENKKKKNYFANFLPIVHCRGSEITLHCFMKFAEESRLKYRRRKQKIEEN